MFLGMSPSHGQSQRGSTSRQPCLDYVVTFWYITSNMFLDDGVVQTGLLPLVTPGLCPCLGPQHESKPWTKPKLWVRQPCLDCEVTFCYVTSNMFLGDWVVRTGLLPIVIPGLCPWLGPQAMDKAKELLWVGSPVWTMWSLFAMYLLTCFRVTE